MKQHIYLMALLSSATLLASCAKSHEEQAIDFAEKMKVCIDKGQTTEAEALRKEVRAYHDELSSSDKEIFEKAYDEALSKTFAKRKR